MTANGPVVNVSQSSSSGRALPVEPDANPVEAVRTWLITSNNLTPWHLALSRAPPSAPDEDLATGRSPSVPVASAADAAIAKLPQQEQDNADNEQNPTSPDTYRLYVERHPG